MKTLLNLFCQCQTAYSAINFGWASGARVLMIIRYLFGAWLSPVSNQWQSHIFTFWDWTLFSKMTTLTPTEGDLSNGLPVVLTSTPLNLLDQLERVICSRMTISTTMADLLQFGWRIWCHPLKMCDQAGYTSSMRKNRYFLTAYGSSTCHWHTVNTFFSYRLL